MAVDDTKWKLEPHTKAKHEILRRYLDAWFPILASHHRRILYVDGFSGPGEYIGGEDGSPVIALTRARDHRMQNILQRRGTELVFFFIERDTPRFKNLERKLTELSLPSNFRVEKKCNDFESAFGSVLKEIEEQSKHLAPSFVFIDPFGPTGFPMSLIKRLAQQPRSEVLINFNYQALNQWFLQDYAKHDYIDRLYGNDVWRDASKIPDSSQKETYLRKLYQDALENLGWKVRPFRMINRHNQTQYYLFFATGHWLGMLVMKQAMWGAAPTGDFSYSDLSNPNQACMFEDLYTDEYAKDLAKIIFQNHKGAVISKQDLVKNDLAWHPVCIEKHLTKALRVLEYEESPAKISEVTLPDRLRRRRTYPDDCTITFCDF